MPALHEAFICDAVRTPIARYGGARLAPTALHPLERTGAKRALATLCVGVGRGVALAIERV